MVQEKQNAPVKWRHSLSAKLMNWVLFTALAVGVLLSIGQIIFESMRAVEEMDNEARQTLAIVRDPATQAVYSIDPDLAQQVLEGLFEKPSIRYAAISHPNQTTLAELSKPLLETQSRWMTDAIFGKEREYAISLFRPTPQPTYYGELKIVVDTAPKSALFFERSILIFMTGLLRALLLAFVLHLVYHFLLTAPLKAIINSLLRINPAEPGLQSLPVPRQHEKDELGSWVRAANSLLQSIEEHQQKRQAAEARIIKLSQYDSLTGLPTRSLFTNYIAAAVDDSEALNQKFAVFCVGIDDFKSINEQLGYSQGDKLLQAFAERLLSQRDGVHTVCRLGGDQFALILFNVSSSYRVAAFAESLLREISRPFEIEEQLTPVSCTIGIAIYPDDARDAEKILQKAEQTMMLAKSVANNHFQFYVASLDSEIRERKKLEKDLSKAIQNDELFLVYQPQIDLNSKQVVGCEALLRWRHPERGLVPPDVFIPIAEANETILEIGDWVLHEACAQVNQWRNQGFNIKVAINLSANQLRQKEFAPHVLKIIESRQIPTSLIELEVTETSFMENLNQAITSLRHLSEFGIQCAVDDFGTGYSSLSYLKQLPIRKIKIDKQFVRDLMKDEDDTQIVHAIIQLGKSLRLDVIAEGVETPRQERFLKHDGCTLAQGYYYSKPVPPDELIEFMKVSHAPQT
ncbi:predicted signal transduction protein containing a membrane domain, an EAL and a GGDEF domain [Hahella chejuensis KCTC 2396]|uniref:cyclic-guanylate-specific phosphodiesterase n=1 Tax=Hahella chejuensis (strain KCTC 2396) TaxID=349521 RepID=Q2SDG6_HAHCH|nr:GGDEF domain-containing phosphodiesterase [Hahella chejuensis]ABC31308.1 predicted signal transduction protein containing a membrane domain, an EAL and a GGDEF domain [Hahella chejuensis KCTC 2396]